MIDICILLMLKIILVFLMLFKRCLIKEVICLLLFYKQYIPICFFPVITELCTYEEYTEIGYQLKPKTDCRQFYQCAPLQTLPNGTITYQWLLHNCPPGLQWNFKSYVCDWPFNVFCPGKVWMIISFLISCVTLLPIRTFSAVTELSHIGIGCIILVGRVHRY